MLPVKYGIRDFVGVDWTAEEDARLIEVRHKIVKAALWKDISLLIYGRTAALCRHRYYTLVLQPKYWTEEQEDQFRDLYRR